MKGIIALDIDGTTAVYGQPITNEVNDYLKHLVKDNWQILFITGRTFNAALRTLKTLDFPYYLAVQNGATTLHMPSKEIIDGKYLKPEILPIMQQICDDAHTGFIIYSGYENKDLCYCKQHTFSNEMMHYLDARAKSFGETWHTLTSFDHLDINKFSSVKCIAPPNTAIQLAQEIESRLGLHVPLIKDPFDESYYVAQATHPDVSKGHALTDLAKFLGHQGVIIAAGDDNNDLTMLQAADVKIVMATAPSNLIAIADIVAPPVTLNGLIAGLKIAIHSKTLKNI